MSTIWTPRRYQDDMLDFSIETQCCALWADMGLGKTVTAATLAQRCLYDLFDVKRVLIVGPKRVAYKAWPDEFRKWQHLRSVEYRLLKAEDFGMTPSYDEVDYFDEVLESMGTTMKKGGLSFGWDNDNPSEAQRLAKRACKKRLQGYREHVHIVSWDFLYWLTKAYGDNWPYDMVIFDESSFVKNLDTARFRACRWIRKFTKRVVELTGTPATRSLLDLWSQVFILDQGKRLGETYGGFRDAYFSPDKRGVVKGGIQRVFSWKPDGDARQRIYGKLSDVVISLKAEDWLHLPPLIENPINIDLPENARQLYDEVENTLIAQLMGGSKVIAQNPAVLVSKLMQISNGCVYDDNKKPQIIHGAKLDALAELNEATPGNMLVAYAFVPERERIQKRFGRSAVWLNTDKAIDDWNAGRIKMGYAHPASLGHGMNLQDGGSTVAWFGPTHNLEHWQQMNKRLHRSGQTAEHVILNTILADNTIDHHVRYDVIADKDTEQSALLAAVDSRIRELKGALVEI